MGEVYRAKDTRLEREVAIKVLPEHFADDEERLRRFEREAKTLASLNHPNVAGIHGIDQVGDTCFLAMELVAGEDLAAKLARGPLPIDEAVDLTPDGTVKLLDFGLAKPTGPLATGGSSSARPDSLLVTEEGLVLGTPTYMSPSRRAASRSTGARTSGRSAACCTSA